MTVFLLGLLIFLGVHSISIVNEPWRDRMVKAIGKWPWKGLYSLVAAFGFVLIIWGYGLSSSDSFDLYVPPLWLHRLALLVLLPVFVLFLAAYFPGRIKKATGHPMLLAICGLLSRPYSQAWSKSARRRLTSVSLVAGSCAESEPGTQNSPQSSPSNNKFLM